MRVHKKAEKRREEILTAALDLFAEQGYQATTLEHISTRIKLARTSLYEYYRSKEDILFALVDSVIEAVPDKPVEGYVRDRLELLAEQSIERLQQNFTIYRILFQEMPALSPATAARLRRWQLQSLDVAYRTIAEGWKDGVFRQGLTEEEVCFAYRALVGQKMAELLMLDGRVDPKQEAERLINILWHGVR